MAITDLMIEELQAWVSRPTDQSLESFLSQRVGAEDAAEILSAVDHGRLCYDELRAAREEGVSREAWLARSLKGHLTRDADTGDVSLELAEGVTLTRDTPAALARSLKDELVSAVWSGEIGEGASDDLQAQVSAPILSPLNEAVEEVAAHAPKPVQELLSDYFTSPINDDGEREVVSVISGAVRRESQHIGPSVPQPSIEHIGSVVDYGMFGAKVAAHVGQGTLTADTAVDLIEDRAAAHIARGVRRFVDKALVAGGATVGGFVGGLIGQAPLGAKIGAVAGKVAGTLISPLIEKGAKVVVKAAKRVVSSIARGAKRVVSGVVSGITSWLGW